MLLLITLIATLPSVLSGDNDTDEPDIDGSTALLLLSRGGSPCKLADDVIGSDDVDVDVGLDDFMAPNGDITLALLLPTLPFIVSWLLLCAVASFSLLLVLKRDPVESSRGWSLSFDVWKGTLAADCDRGDAFGEYLSRLPVDSPRVYSYGQLALANDKSNTS